MAQLFGISGLFGGRKKHAARIESLVGQQTTINGDLVFSGGLHVNGTIVGAVSCLEKANATLTVSVKGSIKGNVNVPRVILDGVVTGDVFASEHIELAANARVHGDVHYRLIEMAMGAEVNGKLVRITDPDRPPLALTHNSSEDSGNNPE